MAKKAKTQKTESAPKKRSARKGERSFIVVMVELEDVEPVVWRRLIVPSDLSLWELHAVLQVSFGWMNSHLMQFEVGKRTFGRPDFDIYGDGNLEDVREVTLGEVMSKPGDTLSYEYDLGDSWRHSLSVEEVFSEDDAPFVTPRCLDGENAAPPENCGGAPGFERLKEVLAGPADEEHQSMIDWLDRYYPDYDPTEFSLSAVNKILNISASRFLEVIPAFYGGA